MSQPTPDRTRWFTELLNSQQALLTAAADGPEFPAARQWGDALSSFTKWQMDSWSRLAGQWAAMFGMAPSGPLEDRRFSGEAWTKDPRFEAVARTYLARWTC